MSSSTTPLSIAQAVAQSISTVTTQMDSFFMFTMASIIFLMQFGFGLFEAGISRSSYTIKRALIKCSLCSLMSMLVFWLFGYAIMYGGTNCVAGAVTYWAFTQMPSTLYSHFWLQFAYAATSVNVAVSALAERGHMAAYLVFAFVWAGFSQPVIAHWVWSPYGFLQTVCGQPFVQGANVTFTPFQDQSGAAVVHLTGGTAALIGALLCGTRTDRFDRLTGQPNAYRPHSTTLIMIGGAILAFGMLALNAAGQLSINSTPASSAALAMINTVLGGTISAFTVYFILQCVRMQASLMRIVSAAVAGMVSVSSDVNGIYTWAACVFGFFGGLTYLFWSWAMQKGKVDDVTDSFAVFAGPAMWSIIGTAFLDSSRGIVFNGNVQSAWFLAWQIIGIVVVFGWAALTALIIFGILRLVHLIRVPEENEMKGVEHYMQSSNSQSTAFGANQSDANSPQLHTTGAASSIYTM